MHPAACALALILSAAVAAERLPGEPLSLEAAVQIALVRNPDYLSLRDAAALADLELETARSAFRTRLSSRFNTSDRTGAALGSTYEIGLSRRLQSGSRWGLGFASSRFSNQALSELKLSYELPLFGNPARERGFAVDAAAIASRHQKQILAMGAQELTAEVAASYYQVVLATNSLALSRNGVELANTLHQVTLLRRCSGASSSLDVRRARLHVAATEREVQQSGHGLERYSRRLALMLGFPPDTDLGVITTVPPVNLETGATVEPDALEMQALQRQPELAALREEITLLRRRARAAAPRALPPMAVSLQLSLVGEGQGLQDSLDAYEPRFGVGFNMALDHGRRNRAERQRFELQLAAAEHRYIGLQNRVRADARDLAQRFAQQLADVALMRESRALAEDDYRVLELRHRAGLVTTEQTLEAAQTLAQARHRELESVVGYWVARYQLDVLLGTVERREVES